MLTLQHKSRKIIPLHTEQTFYYWMSKSINNLKTQGNTSRLLIIGLIIWNLVLTLQINLPRHNPFPEFSKEQSQEAMLEEAIPPFDLPMIKEQ